MNKANNLVNVNQQIDFKNRLDKSHSIYKNEAEQVLFDIYKNKDIDEAYTFENWKRDNESGAEIEEYIEKTLRGEVEGNGGRRKHVTSTYTRSAEVARETKKSAKGICQLCNKKAPFNDKNGEPYLEAHHIVWLSKGGKDSTSNTVALCPNCHKRMHVLDSIDDVDKLLRITST